MKFIRPSCGKTIIEKDGIEYAECLVGGHWTPHSAQDKPPINAFKCCHAYQEVESSAKGRTV